MQCKAIAGILTARPDLLGAVRDAFAERFGAADIVGEWQPFDHTDYYREEMGEGLVRCFLSFERLQPASEAGGWKAFAMAVEDRFSENGGRVVNIDPGYLDAMKVVLISGKHGGHKVALAEDVYADLLLWYNKGWTALPWAFPDFRDGSLFPLFTRMRRRFKEQFREQA